MEEPQKIQEAYASIGNGAWRATPIVLFVAMTKEMVKKAGATIP